MSEPRGGNVLGSGLAWWQYAALVIAAVALFVLWDGPLWTAPAEASHVMRFAVSYLAVIPLAAIALGLVRRFTWTRWLTTLGTVWCIKLVTTWVLYTAFATGTATRLAPKASPDHLAALPPPVQGYVAASGPFEAGVLRGAVRFEGQPAPGAVVIVDSPAPGIAPRADREVVLELRGGHYARPIYVVATTDQLLVSNHDDQLYTVHLYDDARSVANQPVPAEVERRALTIPEPGLYRVRSDTRDGVATWLVVADHPYFATAGSEGQFELAQVPAREAHLVALFVDRDQLYRSSSNVYVRHEAAQPTTFQLSAADAVAARTTPRGE